MERTREETEQAWTLPSVAFARVQWWSRAGGACAQKPHTMSAIDISSSRVLLNIQKY